MSGPSRVHDEEAEKLFLSLCLADPTQIRLWGGQLDPDDFVHANGRIWSAMLDLAQRERPIKPSVEELATYLEARARGGSRTELDVVGGMDYLHHLQDYMVEKRVLEIPKVELFASRIIDHRERGLYLEIANDLEEAARQGGVNHDEMWGDLFMRVTERRQLARIEHFKQIGSAYGEVKPLLDQWWEGKPAGSTPTGFTSLDENLGGGFGKRHLTVLAGLPGSFKTALAAQIGEKIAEGRAHPDVGRLGVGWFSIEMGIQDLFLRSLCRKAGIPMSQLASGHYNIHDPEKGETFKERQASMEKLAEHYSRLPIYVDDSAAPTTAQIYSRSFSLALQAEMLGTPLGLIIIDFADLVMDDNPGYGGEAQRISNIFRRAKAVAKTLQVPVLIIAHLRKEVLKTADKRPRLGDLRYAGHDVADTVLFTWDVWNLYTSEGLKPDCLPEGVILSEKLLYVVIGKARYAKVGYFPLKVNRSITLLSDMNSTRVKSTSGSAF